MQQPRLQVVCKAPRNELCADSPADLRHGTASSPGNLSPAAPALCFRDFVLHRSSWVCFGWPLSPLLRLPEGRSPLAGEATRGWVHPGVFQCRQPETACAEIPVRAQMLHCPSLGGLLVNLGIWLS